MTDAEIFYEVILPQEKRLEQIANSKRHPFRLFANSVLTQLYQMENYYVENPEDVLFFKLEAGLTIAKLEN